MGYVINLLNFPIIAKKSSFSFVPLPMKLGISFVLRLDNAFFRFIIDFSSSKDTCILSSNLS
ncbi:MAG: hypothetical protein ACR5K9_11035 [Wolbachia sp.]